MPSVYANQLEAEFRKAPPTVLLLWGDDAGALRHAAQSIIQLYGVDPADPFAAETFTLAELANDPALLPDKAAAIPFGGGKRLLRLAGVTGEESLVALRPLTDALETAFALPLKEVLILLPIPKLLDKTHAMVKLVEKAANGLAVRFFMDNARDLTQGLENELKRQQAQYTPGALRALAANLGADRELARREVEKLVLYAGGETITEEHVAASVAGATPADVFRLAEAVGRRDATTTDHILTHFIEQGEDLNGAFTQVIRQLQAFATAQALLKQQQPEAEILKKTGKFSSPPDARRAFLESARRYPPRRLTTLATYALETLTAARSGTLPSGHVFSRAILALSA